MAVRKRLLERAGLALMVVKPRDARLVLTAQQDRTVDRAFLVTHDLDGPHLFETLGALGGDVRVIRMLAGYWSPWQP